MGNGAHGPGLEAEGGRGGAARGGAAGQGLTGTHSAGGGGCRGRREGHHLLNGKAQLEPVQGIADADLPLDLRV